jgi:hypothetical protein
MNSTYLFNKLVQRANVKSYMYLHFTNTYTKYII